MPYQISWETPEAVLCLRLLEQVTLQEFVEIDRTITSHLNDSSVDASIALMVDVTETKSVPQSFSELKNSQTYATAANVRLHWILVIGNNRLMRLMMLLTFNLCRPSLRFFDTLVDGTKFISTMQQTKKV
jgi:hypothetical protein